MGSVEQPFTLHVLSKRQRRPNVRLGDLGDEREIWESLEEDIQGSFFGTEIVNGESQDINTREQQQEEPKEKSSEKDLAESQKDEGIDADMQTEQQKDDKMKRLDSAEANEQAKDEAPKERVEMELENAVKPCKPQVGYERRNKRPRLTEEKPDKKAVALPPEGPTKKKITRGSSRKTHELSTEVDDDAKKKDSRKRSRRAQEPSDDHDEEEKEEGGHNKDVSEGEDEMVGKRTCKDATTAKNTKKTARSKKPAARRQEAAAEGHEDIDRDASEDDAEMVTKRKSSSSKVTKKTARSKKPAAERPEDEEEAEDVQGRDASEDDDEQRRSKDVTSKEAKKTTRSKKSAIKRRLQNQEEEEEEGDHSEGDDEVVRKLKNKEETSPKETKKTKKPAAKRQLKKAAKDPPSRNRAVKQAATQDSSEDGDNYVLSERVHKWLDDLGLLKYAEHFEKHEVEDEVLPLLTFEDLREMGICAVGARRKMFTSIRDMEKKLPQKA